MFRQAQKGAVAFSADQRAKQKDYISRSLSKPRLPMKYSLCLLMESKNNFALLSVFFPLAVSTYSFGAKKTLSASKCDSPFDFHVLSAVSGEEHLVIEHCGCALVPEESELNGCVLNIGDGDEGVVSLGHHLGVLVIGNLGIAAVAGKSNV